MVFAVGRKLTATVLGHDPKDPTASQELREAGVPVSDANCRTCADPCDEGHAEFEKRFDVDMETEMRGSVKPYRRQVLISTGKADWGREVTAENHSLAYYISSAEDKRHGELKKASKADPNSPPSPIDKKEKEKPRNTNQPHGVYPYKPSGRLSILNGSHHSIADDPDTHATALVLPDYVAISNVPISAAGADAFWQHALDPAVPRAGTVVTSGGEELKSWALPYNCLIMLCSHKRRDARCHIASLRLEEDFARTLESEGWYVDTDLEDLSSLGPPLEANGSTDEERQAAALAQLKALSGPSPVPAALPSESQRETSNGVQEATQEKQEATQTGKQNQKKALILKNSHIGGHKFAGNVIIYFPQGSSVWYGRVTPHEVHAIVEHTILGGKVLPKLLRGGLGIARPGCASLLDW